MRRRGWLERWGMARVDRPDRRARRMVRRRHALRVWAVWSGAVTAGFAAIVLAGWSLDLPALRGFAVFGTTMQANSAIGFLLGGTALVLITLGSSPRARKTGRALAGTVVAIGLLTAIEHALGLEPLLHGFLPPVPPEMAETSVPGRSAPLTAAGLLLCGVALLLVGRESYRWHRLGEILAVLAGIVAFEVLVGYAYGVQLVGGLPGIARMAVQSAVSLLLLSTGLLTAYPKRGLAGFVSSAGGEGVLARKMLPAALLIPVLIGFVVLLGHEAGWYGAEVALSLVAVVAAVLMLTAVLATTSAVADLDRARRRAEEAYRVEASVARTLNEVGEIITAEMDEPTLVHEITDAATACTTAAFGAFFSRVEDGGGERYRLHSLSGVPRDAFEGFPPPEAISLVETTFHGGPPIRLHDLREDRRYRGAGADGTRSDDDPGADGAGQEGEPEPDAARPMEGPGSDGAWAEGELPLRSYLAVPVRSRTEGVLGGLFFGHPAPGRFTPAHERMAVGIATWAGIALDNARLLRRAQDAMQGREELVAVVSHDLRNALQAATSAARALEVGVGRGEAAQGKLTGIIQRSATQMGRLIQDLLDIHVIETGRLQVEPVPEPLGALVHEAVEVAEPLARERGLALELELEASGPALADRERIIQVLNNLLGNAIKFTPSGGRILVRAREEGERVRVAVSDTGPGIAPDDLAHIFERFWTGSTKGGGAGLGLAIARAIVESHGGRIWVESEEGDGATFHFTLPRPAAGSKLAPSLAGPVSDGGAGPNNGTASDVGGSAEHGRSERTISNEGAT